MSPQIRLQTIVGGTTAGVQSPVSYFSAAFPLVLNGVKIQGYNTSEFIHDAGMVIDPQPITVKAKLLTAPAMQFAGALVVLSLIFHSETDM